MRIKKNTAAEKANRLIKEQVEAIGNEVVKKGDKALVRLTKKLDGVYLEEFLVSPEEIEAAKKAVPAELKKSIQIAKKNIHIYHYRQLSYLRQAEVKTMPGIICYRKFSAIDTVGVYIPGGRSPLFSSALMAIIPAKIAGCKRIVVCTPPNEKGLIDPSILYTASYCGCDEIYKVGGAQAIFAMAYGTGQIPAVQKIVGPGNDYVNEAKKMVSAFLPIDMPAGPSEVMVIADETQPPAIIASDILSQLEHDEHAEAHLIAYKQKTIEDVYAHIKERISISPRKKILEKSIKNYQTHLAHNDKEVVRIADEYAPEHLIIATKNAKKIALEITHAGSVFIGKYAAESLGDYASGTNHILPTSGYAKAYSGLSVESFGKWTSFQEIEEKGFVALARAVKTMSEYEGLIEHKQAVEQREKWLLKK